MLSWLFKVTKVSQILNIQTTVSKICCLSLVWHERKERLQRVIYEFSTRFIRLIQTGHLSDSMIKTAFWDSEVNHLRWLWWRFFECSKWRRCNRKMWSQCFFHHHWISGNTFVRQEYYTLLNALALTSQCRNSTKNLPMQRISYSSIYTMPKMCPFLQRTLVKHKPNKWTQVQKFFRESLKSVKCKVCCH